MSNEKWSPWIEWHGGECPLPDGAMHETRFRSGEEVKDDLPETSYWGDDGDDCDIIAYRYRIQENEMHPDLEWLAKNVSEWDDEYTHVYHMIHDGPSHYDEWHRFNDGQGFTKSQWLQARKDLGLEPSGISDPDEEECLQLAYERMSDESVKVSLDAMHHMDWSTTITDTPEEAAMVEDMVNGKKYDGEKPRMDLIPPFMEEEVAMVLAFGARKYDADNWRKVTPLRSRYLAAAQRHINALKKGEQMDPESGLHHAAHAACCLMFLGEVELEPSK